jgi:hypothetical protein
MKERRRLAIASPLRQGMSLVFITPSLYPESIYSPSPNSVESPNPARRASSTLLKLLATSKHKNLQIHLKKGVLKGKDHSSQVWRAELEVAGRRKKVVVKLYAEALFELPTPTMPRSTEQENVESEAQA